MPRRRKATCMLAQSTAILLGCAALPTLAQTSQDEWRFAAIVYGYLPAIGGSATFRTGTPVNITVDPNNYLSNLSFAFMGAFEAQRGSFGLFTDVIYVDVSGSKSATRDFSLGRLTIPGAVTADASLNVKSTVWTLGGSYRIAATPQATFDVLVGARALFLDQHLNWHFSADVGPFVGPGRQGSGDSNPTDWDGIVGVKGRLMFGDRHAWFVPYYFDVGTGESQLTWQALGGLGYTFHWGEVIGVWRYIDWHFSKDSARLSLNGPAIGVAFHW
jgi:hypothetical protein